MLIDTKMNPFASAAGAPKQKDSQPVGILNIETPQNVPMPHEPSMVESGIGMAKDKALDVAMEKGTEMATSAATKAAAGKGGQAAATSGAMAGKGLMAAAAPMAAPLIIGGLLAHKLFK